MRIISTFVHGAMDYLGGILLLLAPEIFGFSEIGGAAVLVPRILGVVVLLQALCTDYELGMFRLLSMRTHLMNDYIASVFLAASPWLFGFNDEPARAWVPHVVIGLLVLGASLMTQQVPSRRTAYGAANVNDAAERSRRRRAY